MTQYVWFVRGQAHANLCATSIAAARRADHAAKCLVMTDDADVRLPDGVHAELKQFPPGMPIMLANLEAQVQAFRHAGLSDRIVFLDTDVLLLEALPFSLAKDLIVTWRDRVGHDDDGEPVEGLAKTMPYNYGVIGAYNRLPALEAFIFMRERVRVMATRLQHWYGNQVALAQLCGARPVEGEQLDVRNIPWLPTQAGNPLAVYKIPCARWNYTPREAGESLHGVSAVHFKGPARKLMKGYADRFHLGWHEDQLT